MKEKARDLNYKEKHGPQLVRRCWAMQCVPLVLINSLLSNGTYTCIDLHILYM